MPTRILYRKWCKTCGKYELHDRHDFTEAELFCKICDSKYVSTPLLDIPVELVIEQRTRYTQSEIASERDIFNSMLLGTGLWHMLDIARQHNYTDKIIEADAGQIAINQRRNEQLEEARKKQHEQQKLDLELKNSFHKLGRNDKCLCGSRKKYKKCCYLKIQAIY